MAGQTFCIDDDDCDDGNVCTREQCQSGQCEIIGMLRCDDLDACNGAETCDSATGCVAGTPIVCDDGNVCNGLEICNSVFGAAICISIPPTAPLCAVGGEIIPIGTTSLILAGTQSAFSWMIPITVSAVGIAIVIARKF